MSRFLKVSGIALLSLFFLVPSASAQFRRGFGYGPRWGGGWAGVGTAPVGVGMARMRGDGDIPITVTATTGREAWSEK